MIDSRSNIEGETPLFYASNKRLKRANRSYISIIIDYIKKLSTWSVDYDNLSRILYRIISFKLKAFVGYLLAAMSQQVKAIKKRVWVTR